jgi:hypothetical protein
MRTMIGLTALSTSAAGITPRIQFVQYPVPSARQNAAPRHQR